MSNIEEVESIEKKSEDMKAQASLFKKKAEEVCYLCLCVLFTHWRCRLSHVSPFCMRISSLTAFCICAYAYIVVPMSQVKCHFCTQYYMWWAIGALIVLAIALILYFSLRSKTPE